MISPRLLLKASLLVVTIFLLGPGSGIARDSGDGFDTVKRVVNIFSVWGGKEPNKNLLKELTSYIDYNEMAERSLGKYWFDLTPLDRREYAFVFRKQLFRHNPTMRYDAMAKKICNLRKED